MQKDLLKYRKVITSIACFHLILISNNSELAAKYLSDKAGETIKTHIIDKDENDLFLAFDLQQKNNVLIADNVEKLKTAKDGESVENLKSALDELNNAWNQVASKMYDSAKEDGSPQADEAASPKKKGKNKKTCYFSYFVFFLLLIKNEE